MKTLKTLIAGLHLMTIIYFFVIAMLKYVDALPGAGFYLFVSIGLMGVYLMLREYYQG